MLNKMRVVHSLQRDSFCNHLWKNLLMGKAEYYNGFKILKMGKQQMCM